MTDTPPDEPQDFAKNYSEDSLWSKVAGYAKAAGKDVVEKALWLFYAAKKDETPAWAKGVIISALGYFISPIDAIPDFTPIVGYADDLGVLVAAVGTVAVHIDATVKTAATKKLKDWFGD